LDLSFHEAKIKEDGIERKLDLTPIEFKILYCLAKSREQVLSRNQLIDSVWGSRVHISRPAKRSTFSKPASAIQARRRLQGRRFF